MNWVCVSTRLLSRLDWFQVQELANTIEQMGDTAVSGLRQLAEFKHRRALVNGKAYINPAMAQEMAVVDSVVRAFAWANLRQRRNRRT